MPYIIETSTHEPLNEHMALKTPTGSVAVATLDEAREAAAATVNAAWTDRDDAGIRPHYRMRNRALNLPGEGGTVGPLPDGTVIEVRKINGYTLAGEVANATGEPCRVFDAVSRYNAR